MPCDVRCGSPPQETFSAKIEHFMISGIGEAFERARPGREPNLTPVLLYRRALDLDLVVLL